jgi:SAM-dependent methyltransferase
VSGIADPAWVEAEYASERGLAGRKAAYRFATGPDPRELAFAAVAEAAPARMLEVGCGEGELAERFVRELGAEVVAIDRSPRMVELTRARGVPAEPGDVQDLSRFADATFDVAFAGWMLYHVAEIDRALAELARVLRPGGRLVAVTNGDDHLRELRELVGVSDRVRGFGGANGADLLRRSFARVERRDAAGWIEFPDRAAVEAYVDAASGLWARPLSPELDVPLRVRRSSVVFVAETPS